MIDEEGVIQSVDVNAKFINGKPAGIEAKYVMRSPREWDRFMRFMERYSNANGLQFVKKWSSSSPNSNPVSASVLLKFCFADESKINQYCVDAWWMKI